MPPEKTATEQSIKARQREIFEKKPEAPKAVVTRKPFVDYLRDTPAAPLPMGAKAGLAGVGLVVAVLFSFALGKASHTAPADIHPPEPRPAITSAPAAPAPAPAPGVTKPPAPAAPTQVAIVEPPKAQPPPPKPPEPPPAPPEPEKTAAPQPKPEPPDPARPAVAGLERLDVVLDQGIAVARITDRALVQQDDIDVLGKDLATLINAKHIRIVLDFTDVESISPRLVIGLVTYQQQLVKQLGGLIKLVGHRPEVYEVFRSTSPALRYFDFYPDRESALQSPWSQAEINQARRKKMLEKGITSGKKELFGADDP